MIADLGVGIFIFSIRSPKAKRHASKSAIRNPPLSYVDLVHAYIPHAPQHGLYLAPDLPEKLLRNALNDYASSVLPEEVLAIYDATMLGSAKDGAVFTADRLVYQNNDLEQPQEIRYRDIVRVETKKKLLGGRIMNVDVNRANATVTHKVDFSGKPKAATYIARFLHEAMLTDNASAPAGARTDPAAVLEALDRLQAEGKLTDDDYHKMAAVLHAA